MRAIPITLGACGLLLQLSCGMGPARPDDPQASSQPVHSRNIVAEAARSSTDVASAPLTQTAQAPAGTAAAAADVGLSLQRPVRPLKYAPTWVLTWSDEFNDPNGSTLDPTKWVFETGGNGWGNNELEYYTARTQNVQQANGNLVITALQETYTGPDNVTRNYTSARIKTAGLFSQAYGRFEARIKVPFGQGLWPAFWMLGDNFGTVGWPTCGELDIMENIGREPAQVHGSMHGPGYSGATPLTGSYTLPAGRFADDFHTFAIEWKTTYVSFFVDGVLYETHTPADIPQGTTWVFDHPFFIVLNVAVGGSWPGSPDSTTVFPQTMLVDYVRVYTWQ